jgi:hypothetical protein
MVENIVIRKPIVDSWTMFSKDLDDWNRLEKDKTLFTDERFLPKVLVEIGATKSTSEIRRNRPDLFRSLNKLDYEEIKLGKNRLFILVGE